MIKRINIRSASVRGFGWERKRCTFGAAAVPILAAFVLVFSSSRSGLYAQAQGSTPPDSWSAAFTGAGMAAADIQATADGGFIITGSVDKTGSNPDILVLRLDATGKMKWFKTFGDKGPDRGVSIHQTRDGGYIVAARTESYGGKYAWIIKLNFSGAKEWDRVIADVGATVAQSIVQTQDGGYLLTGSEQGVADLSGLMAARLDSTGEIDWIRDYGGEEGRDLTALPDGGYMVIGSKKYGQNPVPYIWVLNLDPEGEIIWENHFGHGGRDEAYDIRMTLDGGYIIAGASKLLGPEAGEALILKLDAAGRKEWEKSFGGIQTDMAFAALQTPDGGYVLAGRTSSSGAGLSDGWLLGLDPEGNLLWEKTFGGAKNDWLSAAALTPGGGMAMAGVKNSATLLSGGELWVLKTDLSGEIRQELPAVDLFNKPAPAPDLKTQPPASQPQAQQGAETQEPARGSVSQPQPALIPAPLLSPAPANSTALTPETPSSIPVAPPDNGAGETTCPNPSPGLIACPIAAEEVFCSKAGRFTIERYPGWLFNPETSDIITAFDPITRSNLLARFINPPAGWENPEVLEKWLADDLTVHFPAARIIRWGEVDVRGKTGYMLDMDLTGAGPDRFDGAHYRTLVFPRGGKLLQFAALWDSRDLKVQSAVDCMFLSVFQWE